MVINKLPLKVRSCFRFDMLGMKTLCIEYVKMFITDNKYITFMGTTAQWRIQNPQCVKSVGIRSYSGPGFPAFGLNTKKYGVSLRIQPECGKIRTRITPNTDTL